MKCLFVIHTIYVGLIRFYEQYQSVLMIERELFALKLSNVSKHGQYFSFFVFQEFVQFYKVLTMIFSSFAGLFDRASTASTSLRF